MGVEVHKINICGNDIMDWHHKGAINFDGKLEDWPDFLSQTARKLGVTHILLHGDRRPYHKPAIQWAKGHSAKVFVTELGYLRPDWITIEPWGTSMMSLFPRTRHEIENICGSNTELDLTPIYPDNLWSIIYQEFRWTFFNLLYKRRFPHFTTHRSQSPWLVYSGWLISKLQAKISKQYDVAQLPKDKPYFIMGLQLEGDFQLRENSPFNSVSECIEYVIKSFANNAESNSYLIFKPHPHEFRQRKLKKDIEELANKFKIKDRIRIVKNVPISTLCKDAAGFITVNSSAGFEALSVNCPTCTVAQTIYSIKGLTFQGTTDEFWRSVSRPDQSLLKLLQVALSNSIQVRGTLYNRKGLVEAARYIGEKLYDKSA